MVSAQLEALVGDDDAKTYLETIDGFWADLVLSEFGFLLDRGGAVTEVSFHQKGDYVRYEGPWGAVVLEFAPDNYPDGSWIGARAAVRAPAGSIEGDLDRLVRERAPGAAYPSMAVLDQETIADNLRLWAVALRSAEDLF
jgi:hypothetical protein